MSNSVVSGSYVSTTEKVTKLSLPLVENTTSATTVYTLDTTKSYDISYTLDRYIPQSSADVLNNLISSQFNYFSTQGSVKGHLEQADGKILVWGAFIYQLKESSFPLHLIRFNADGTWDSTFQPFFSTEGTQKIWNIIQQSDGKLLIAGSFVSTISSTNNTRSYKDKLIRLNLDGTEDTTFTANAITNGTTAYFSAKVINITIQSDNKILLSGSFSYKVTKNKYLIRLNSDGTEDTIFTTNAVNSTDGLSAAFDYRVQKTIQRSDNKLMIGGMFTTYKGVAFKTNLLCLNLDGTEDTTFTTNAVTDGTQAYIIDIDGTFGITTIYDMCNLTNNRILITGAFNTFKNQTRYCTICLNYDGTENIEFTQNAINDDTTIKIYGNQYGLFFAGQLQSKISQLKNKTIVISGFPLFYDSFTKQRSELLSFNEYGVVNDLFVNNYQKIRNCDRTLVQSNGKIIFFGSGTYSQFEATVGGASTTVRGPVRFNSDGTLDLAFFSTVTTKFASTQTVSIYGIIEQTDGKLIIYGNFSGYGNNLYIKNLIRLNSDLSIDNSFANNAITSGAFSKINGSIRSVIIQSNNQIILAGEFTNYASATTNYKNYLIRLNSDGTEDTLFTANAVTNGISAYFNNIIIKIIQQSDGKLLIGGTFGGYKGGTGKSFLIRLNLDGTEDTVFTTNAVTNGTTVYFSSQITTLLQQADGKLLISGFFRNYKSGTGKWYVIRLNLDGTEDTVFTTNAVTDGTSNYFNSPIEAIYQQFDKIILTGGFTYYKTLVPNIRDSIIKLNLDGTLDTGFNNMIYTFGSRGFFVDPTYASPMVSRFIIGDTRFKFQGKYWYGPYIIDYDRRTEKGSIQATTNNGKLVYTTPTVINDSTNPTGMTVTFNSDGTIQYTCTNRSDPSYASRTLNLIIREI